MNKDSRVFLNYPNKITQNYKEGVHNGIDLVANVNGKSGFDYIVAHSDGEVVGVRNNYNKTDATGNSYGNYVKIKHDGYYTIYAHLKYESVRVSIGDKVSKGQVIGYMGNTGHSKGAHLHFEVRNNEDKRINPLDFINGDLPSNEKDVPEKPELPKPKLSSEEIKQMALDVIKGKYGNGEERKKSLGVYYNEVQKLVNEALKNVNSKNIYTVKKGDTLSTIAKKYKTTWQHLYELNRNTIDSTAKAHGIKAKYGFYNFIYPGQKLITK